MERKKNIGVSPELEIFMALQGLSTLEDLLAIEDENLLKLEGFGWRLMKEVLKLREIE